MNYLPVPQHPYRPIEIFHFGNPDELFLHDSLDLRENENTPVPSKEQQEEEAISIPSGVVDKVSMQNDLRSDNYRGSMVPPDCMKVFHDFILRARSLFKIFCLELPFTQRRSMDSNDGKGNLAFSQQLLLFGIFMKAFETIEVEIDMVLYVSENSYIIKSFTKEFTISFYQRKIGESRVKIGLF